MTKITGGCLCKAVRYEISSDPVATRVCWCRDCQYWAAGNGTVNVIFNKDSMKLTGTLTDYTSGAASGSHMHRSFCAKCGTPVLSEAEERPTMVIVRAGTLDDPEVAKPGGTIWVKSAPTWACINETLPRFDAQPPPAPAKT